jgi:hypothetical protein
MKKIENKEALIKDARIAKQVPEEREFWGQVRKRMDVREKGMVKPRKFGH